MHAAPRALPIEQQALQPYGQHPYVSFRAGPNRMGQWWIEAHCRACGDTWRKPCFHPPRTNEHLARYAIYHAHGLRPVT